MKTLRISLILLGVLCAPAYAGGGGGGFAGATEPTQILNNMELVSQVGESMTQTATQINQLVQLQQMITELPSDVLGSIGISTENFGSMRELMSTVGTAIKVGRAMNGNLGQFRGIIQGYERRANLANQDVMGYVQSEIDRQVQTGQGLDVERGVERQAMDNIKSNYDNYQNLMGRIGGTQGIRDSMQLLNGSMGNVIGSIDNLTSVTTSMQRMSVQEAEYQRQMREDMARNAANSVNRRINRETNEQNVTSVLSGPSIRVTR